MWTEYCSLALHFTKKKYLCTIIPNHMTKNNARNISVIGHIVDIRGRRIYDGTLRISDGHIQAIEPCESTCDEAAPASMPYILPPFVDAHIHIESTLLTPRHYARMAVTKGVTCAVADPHEIANVLGIKGVEYMINDGKAARFHFHFGAPSCVPSSPYETAGAKLDAKDVAKLLRRKEIYGLAEMMNYPGVLAGDKEVLAKTEAARKLNKPIDGHAPGLRGEQAKRYIDAGITTDHECTTLQEAEERIRQGMKVLIREGSAARNLDALCHLLASHDRDVMFCSDDLYADDLSDGYIDDMVKRAIANGMPFWNVLTAACVTPLQHYGLSHGTLEAGSPADFICVDNFRNLSILRTFVDGVEVYNRERGVTEENFCLAESMDSTSAQADFPAPMPRRKKEPGDAAACDGGDGTACRLPNCFHSRTLSPADIIVVPQGNKMRCIVAQEAQLYTTGRTVSPLTIMTKGKDGNMLRNVVSDPQHDVLKLIVLNRYDKEALPAIAFVKGFGLKRGALASTVAHDSHNIIALGCSDEEIVRAVNQLVQIQGGLCICDGSHTQVLPLPVAGLMSPDNGEKTAHRHQALRKKAHELGCRFRTPFMTLSFLALPVIPELKLTDRGLFDSEHFQFTQLFE